jgi:guanylate kinase
MAQLIVISGASGVGKTSLAQRLLAHPRFERAVTATTRTPRGQERDGVDYHFLSRPQFEADIAAGRFLEYADVYGRLYGTPRENVERILQSGQNCVLLLDVQGVESLRAADVEALYVFVTAPSMEELERRLRTRGNDEPQALEARIRAARDEMTRQDRFDRILVNDEIERAARELAAWVGVDLDATLGDEAPRGRGRP